MSAPNCYSQEETLIMRIIGHRLLKRLRNQVLTMDYVAEKMRINKSTVEHYFRGSNIPLTRFLQLCEILNISPNYVLTGRDEWR